jgi:Protein of unknown function (DUF3037)
MESQPKAQIIYLRLFLPNRPERNAGVLLFEEDSGLLHFRMRHDWDQIADPEDAQVLVHFASYFEQRIKELGETSGETFLAWLEDRLSNVLRLSERETILPAHAQSTLDRLFEENCRA